MLAVDRYQPAPAGAAQVLRQLSVDPAPGAGQRRFSADDLGQYSEDLRRFARRRVRDSALADDAVQDALVAAMVSLPSFQGASSLKTWLLGILAHKIQDAFRRETRYVRFAPAQSEEGPGNGDDPVASAGALISDRDPVQEVSRSRFGACVVEAVERLPASLRQVFVMQAIEGLSTEEVCLRLGISEANCWVRLHRARKRLSVQLAAHF
ncbi:MAG: sigma-70 family RNA polymerase sigma factor [Lautropia sp.]